MSHNILSFTVNPFSSLENIMAKVNEAAGGKIVDGIFITRKSFFKSEIEILVGKSEVVYVPKYIEVEKEVEVIKEVPVEVVKMQVIHKKARGRKPIVKYKQNATSRYRGVCKINGKFRAAIYHNGRKRSVGTYTSEIDAARAYNKSAIELKGKKAILNQIVGE